MNPESIRVGPHYKDDPPALESGRSNEDSLGNPPTRVIRSKRRTKTSQARLVDGCLEVRIPHHISEAEELETVEYFRRRLLRQRAAAEIDLPQRAACLAQRHQLPEPDSIRWVSNQTHRWGSCTPCDRSIRLSDRLAAFPHWVIDYVIVHELAHLRFADHGVDFWALVDRYPLSERARGFLIAQTWCP